MCDKAGAARQRGELQSSRLRGDGILGPRYRHASRGRRKHLVTTTSTIPCGTAVVSSIVGNGTAFMVEGSGTLDIVDGGVVSRPKAKSVTHVSGTACHLCLRPLIQYLVGELESPQREVLTASHWGSPRRFGPRDLAESERAPAPRRESARKRPVSRRRNPFGAARAIIHPLATPGTRMPSAPRRRCALKPSLYQHPARWCTISAPARPQSHRVVPCNHRPMSVGKSRRSADIGRKKAATKQLV